MGKWNEVASYPMPFSLDCLNATADYTLMSNGKVNVVNTCFSAQGSREALGLAYAESAEELSEGRLKIEFEFPTPGMEGPGDYWVLDTDYKSFSIVSGPGGSQGSGLYLLSREPTVDADLFCKMVTIANSMGYETSGLRVNQATIQPSFN